MRNPLSVSGPQAERLAAAAINAASTKRPNLIPAFYLFSIAILFFK
jgi:hypothetical protein